MDRRSRQQAPLPCPVVATSLLFNFLSALTFPLGALLAYAVSFRFDIGFLIPFAAGNFLYIAASDLVPEIKTHHGLRRDLIHLFLFATGAGLLYLLAVLLG